jgi:hypothetical protein
VNAFAIARLSGNIGAALLLAAATIFRGRCVAPNPLENGEAKVLELLPIFWRRYLYGVEIHVSFETLRMTSVFGNFNFNTIYLRAAFSTKRR